MSGVPPAAGAPPEVPQGPPRPRRAAHLEPLRHALGDADSELGDFVDTPLAFLAVRLILSLSFHDHLVRETEAKLWSLGSQVPPDTPARADACENAGVQSHPFTGK